MNPSVETPLVELTTDEMWCRLGVQLFQVTEGVRSRYAYVVRGGRAHLLCGGMGGHGIQSACVTDLDGDEVLEAEREGSRLVPRIELAPLSEEHAAAIWRSSPGWVGDDV